MKTIEKHTAKETAKEAEKLLHRVATGCGNVEVTASDHSASLELDCSKAAIQVAAQVIARVCGDAGDAADIE